MPKLLEAIGGAETKIYCQAAVCWTCVLAVPQTIKVGLPKFGNEGKPLNNSEKLYLLPIYSRYSNIGHRPQYKTDNDTADIDVCPQKCQVCV
jgi:hypothetical protein